MRGMAFLGGHPVSCTAKTIHFSFLLTIPHSYVDQILTPAPFLQLKGKRNCSRPLEYVPVAFKCPEIKIKSGVRGYLAVPVDILRI